MEEILVDKSHSHDVEYPGQRRWRISVGQLEQFVKPAMAAWRASIFFVFGIVILFVSTIWHAPYADIKQNRLFYYDFIDKVFGNIDNIGQWILYAGGIYALLVGFGEYLWTSKLENSIDRGFQTMSEALTIGSARISHNSVSKWIANSAETPDKYKLIALSFLCKCYGAHCFDWNGHFSSGEFR